MIYVDLLVIKEVLINYCILLSISILLNRKTKLKKIFLASVLGSIPLILLFIKLNKTIIFIINLIFITISNIISFNYIDIIYTIKNITYTYFISIFLSGTLYLISINFINIMNSQITNFIFLIILSPIITKIYIKNLINIKINYKNFYNVILYLTKTKKIKLKMYLDTGNKLIDPYSKKPVIIVNKKIINTKNIKKYYIPYKTINTTNIIECFKPEKIYIDNYGERKKVVVGLSETISIEGTDGILNEKVLERI